MKELLKKFLLMLVTSVVAKIVWGFLVVLPAVSGLLHLVQEGSLVIPAWTWYVAGAALVIGLTIYFLIKRAGFVGKKNKKMPMPFLYKPPGGWKEVGYEEHFKVLWQVRFPNDSFSRSFDTPSPEQHIKKLNIYHSPYCPKCITEVDEKYDFFGNFLWGRYVWSCVNCNYKVRSKLKFHEAVEIVDKKVKGGVRREVAEEQKKYR
jgi:hypothetical protein